MAITITERASRGDTSAANSHAFTLESNFSTSSFAVLIVMWEAANADPSVSDTDGNTWTLRIRNTNTTPNPDVSIAIFTANSVALTTTDTVTVTYTGTGGTASDKAAYLFEIGGVSPEYKDSSGAGFSSNGTITSNTIEMDNLIIGAFIKDSLTVPTGDSDTVNGNWSSLFGGSVGSTWAGYQYKVVTADGTQTYNITTTRAGSIAYIEIGELSDTSFDPFGQSGIFGI